jgi:hypothetical protein
MVEVEMLVELVFEIVEKDASYDMIIEMKQYDCRY